MLGLLVFVLTGMIVGTIARALMPSRDLGVGLTILLGTAAHAVVWFGSGVIGWGRLGQPLTFLLSIGAAVVFLHVSREAQLREIAAAGESQAAGVGDVKSLDCSRGETESLLVRIALVPVWAALGALMLGVTGFVIGFWGPMRFQPWSNQGPMLGIFVTGPAGVLLGALLGGALKLIRPDWPMRWRLWVLNAATVLYGSLVLHVVVDRSWWP